MHEWAQVGARMAKLELRKKAAVDKEDYDSAKVIKAEMDKLRAGLRSQRDREREREREREIKAQKEKRRRGRTYPNLAPHIYIK